MRLSIRLGPGRLDENPRLKRMLVLLVIVGIPSVVYTYVYPRVAERVEAMQRQLEQEKAELEGLRIEAEKARDAPRQLAAARARLDDLGRVFPPRVDQPRLLEYLENAAKAEGLRITKLNYGPMEVADPYHRIPVELTVTGPFPGHTNFALALQGMPWLFRFDGVTLKSPVQMDGLAAPPGAGPVPGKVEAVYKVWLYIDVPAPAPPPPPDQGNPPPSQGAAADQDTEQAIGVAE